MKIKSTQDLVYNLVLAGLLTALGIFLPSVFHTFGMAGGKIFLPMHIPVLLCGLICGYKLGGICGLLVPLLSSIIAGSPPIYPVAIIMMVELCVYAVVAGLLFKKTNVYVSLIGAMVAGRIALALAQLIIMGFGGAPFVFGTFIASAFVTALPGIIIQIVLIPLIAIFTNKIVNGKFSVNRC